MNIRLLVAGAPYLAREGWRSQNILDPYWRFYRNEDAGAFLTLGGEEPRRFPLEPGCAYFVPAGVRFCIGSAADFRHFYLHFDVAGLPRLLLHTLFTEPVAIPTDVDWEGRVADLSGQVRETPRGPLPIPLRLRAKALIYEGMARYLSVAIPAAQDRLAAESVTLEPVAPALEAIEAQLDAPHSVATLAAHCCLSPDHFARRFRACLGQTPGAYLRERRVARAAQQLLFSDDSLDTIALACGFGSRFYLTRIFTRVMGGPPAAYRRTGPRA